MKKLLLLIALLMFSFNMSAQQFIKYYYQGQNTLDGVTGSWFNTTVKAYFNYNNDTTRVLFDVNGTYFYLTQVGTTTRDTTTTGLGFQKMEMIDDKTGDPATVELFDDTRYGFVIMFGDNKNYMQFAP
jgi:hypothetical protein